MLSLLVHDGPIDSVGDFAQHPYVRAVGLGPSDEGGLEFSIRYAGIRPCHTVKLWLGYTPNYLPVRLQAGPDEEMVNRILGAGGKPPVRRKISPEAAYRIGTVLEWVYRSFNLRGEPKMTRFVARELATSHWFDMSAARQDLGYRHRISTEEGLRRLRQWLQDEKLRSKV